VTLVAKRTDQRDAYREKGRRYRASLTSQTVEKWPQLREISEIGAGREAREEGEQTRAS
jgi:hypothetical protein